MTAPSPRGELTQEVTPHRGAAIPFNCQVGHPSQRQLVCLGEDKQRPRHPDDNLRPLQELSPPQTDTKNSREEEKRRGTFVTDSSCRGREVL